MLGSELVELRSSCARTEENALAIANGTNTLTMRNLPGTFCHYTKYTFQNIDPVVPQGVVLAQAKQ